MSDQDIQKLEARLVLCERRLSAVADAVSKIYGHTIFVKPLCKYVFGEASEAVKVAEENEKALDEAMDKLTSAFEGLSDG